MDEEIRPAGFEPATLGLGNRPSEYASHHRGRASDDRPGPLAPQLAASAREPPSPLAATPADPDLARVLDAWPSLPPHIRAAVLALVQTAPPADFVAVFDDTFRRLDRDAGGHNLVR